MDKLYFINANEKISKQLGDGNPYCLVLLKKKLFIILDKNDLK